MEAIVISALLEFAKNSPIGAGILGLAFAAYNIGQGFLKLYTVHVEAKIKETDHLRSIAEKSIETNNEVKSLRSELKGGICYYQFKRVTQQPINKKGN